MERKAAGTRQQAKSSPHPLAKAWSPFIAIIVACFVVASTDVAVGQSSSACLIAYSESSPFSSELRDGAVEKSQELQIGLNVSFGQDANQQIAAVESCISQGVKGILIEPADSTAIVSVVQRAREAGILVIAVGAELNPPDAADATLATDQVVAGEVAAIWAHANLGTNADAAAFLIDGNLPRSSDGSAAEGFLNTFPLKVDDPSALPILESSQTINSSQAFKLGDIAPVLDRVDSSDLKIGAILTTGSQFEERLDQVLQKGVQDKVPLIAFGGGCNQIHRLSGQGEAAVIVELPREMAAFGIEGIVEFVRSGAKPTPTTGGRVIDVGTALVFDGVRVQMPAPICRINPRFCTLKVLSVQEALNACQ
jgi:fructose transport system substrate-binding protein